MVLYKSRFDSLEDCPLILLEFHVAGIQGLGMYLSFDDCIFGTEMSLLALDIWHWLPSLG